MAASAYITLTARDAVTPTLKKIQGEMEAMARGVRRFGDNFTSFATLGFGTGTALGIYEVGKASIEAQIQLERLDKSFTAIYGSAATARQQLEFVRETSTAMGQEFYSAADAARTFFAAGQGTTLSGQLNEIYAGFSKAGAALGLSSDDMQGIFLALGQSMSKSKVQAEELRGQIGERLPGAFQVAARAMGVSTAELDKMMADGKLLAEDLLPRMAEVLEQQYGAAAESAADTVQGAVNRMSTAWTDFKAGILDSEPVVKALNAITEALNGINAAMGAKEAGEDLTKRMLADEGFRSHRSWYERDGTLWGVFSKREMVYDFTPEQKAAYAEYEKIQAAVDNYMREQAAREEKILGNFRSAAAELAKKTYEGQAKALKELRDDRIKAAREAASLLADPGEADKLIAEANAQYQRDMAALDKRFSGPKSAGQKIQEKVQRQVAGFAEDTRQLLAQVESLRQSMDAAGGNLDSVEMAQAKAEAGLAKKMASNSWQAVAKADPLAYERRVALEREKIQLESRQKIAEIEKDFLDDARETLNGGYEQERAALDARYELYKKHVTDKSLVDQWYEQERRKIDRDPWSGIARTTDEYFRNATNWAEHFGAVWGNTMDGMADALTDFCMTGKLDFNEMVNSMSRDIVRIQWQAAVSGLFKGMTSFVGGLFGFGGDMDSLVDTASSAMQAIPGIAHSGWYVGREVPADGFRSVPAMAFAGAPRLHSGGGWFRSDEYPAILQRGERVLNRDETAAYHAGMQAGGYGGSQVVVVEPQVHIENNTASTVRTETSMSGGVPRIDIFIDEIDSRLADRIGSGRSRLGRAIDMTRGTNRARSTY